MSAEQSPKIVIVDESPIRAAILEEGLREAGYGSVVRISEMQSLLARIYALDPDIKVIAPWREWDLTSRTRLIEYADQHQIPIARDKRGEAPFSAMASPMAESDSCLALSRNPQVLTITTSAPSCLRASS